MEGDAASLVYGEIPEAISKLQVAPEIRQAAIDWLEKGAFDAWPNAETSLYFNYGSSRVEAFFSVCKTDRIGRQQGFPRRWKPASEIIWLCRNTRLTIPSEKEILGRAAVTAAGLWRDRDVTVVIDPAAAVTRLTQEHDSWLPVAEAETDLWLPFTIPRGEEPWD